MGNVCLKVNSSKVEGLVGENGAGKSKLMNILGGYYQEILVRFYYQEWR
ncbi:MAG: ATP-binding cassette domain-containing protein [Actinobacteria bacterium]|nr:ATP-binding cassette domain-containing protein [Actinomycetota bacterium]